MAKLNFTEIILICLFGAQVTFLIIINVENSIAASFCGNHDAYFSGFFKVMT